MSIFKKKENLIFGKAKPMEDVSLEDFQKNPIWIFDLEGENIEGQDETWLKPILNSTNVASNMVEVYILLYEQNKKIYVSACLDIKRKKLNDIALWIDNSWKPFESFTNDKNPMILYSVPSIENQNNLKFEILK